MQYLYRITALMSLIAALVFSVHAEEEAAKPKKPMPEMVELTLAGRLVKVEKTVKGKDGAADKTVISYAVETADGKIALPAAPKAKKGETAIDYSTMVEQNVNVAAQGFVKTVKKGKGEDAKDVSVTTVKKVISIAVAE